MAVDKKSLTLYCEASFTFYIFNLIPMGSLSRLKSYAEEKLSAARSKLPDLPVNITQKFKRLVAATIAMGALGQTIDAQAPQDLAQAHLSDNDDSAHVKVVNTNDFKPATPLAYNQPTNTVVVPRHDVAKPSTHKTNKHTRTSAHNAQKTVVSPIQNVQVSEPTSITSNFQQSQTSSPINTVRASTTDERVSAAPVQFTEEQMNSLLKQYAEIQREKNILEQDKKYLEVQAEMRKHDHSVVEIEIGTTEDGKPHWTQKSIKRVSLDGQITPEDFNIFRNQRGSDGTGRVEQAEAPNAPKPSPGPIFLSLPGDATIFENRGDIAVALIVAVPPKIDPNQDGIFSPDVDVDATMSLQLLVQDDSGTRKYSLDDFHPNEPVTFRGWMEFFVRLSKSQVEALRKQFGPNANIRLIASAQYNVKRDHDSDPSTPEIVSPYASESGCDVRYITSPDKEDLDGLSTVPVVETP